VWLAHAIPAFASDQNAKWMTSYSDALRVAQEQGKPLLVSFSAPWCGWCRVMEKETFALPSAAALIEDYVRVKVDIDKDTETARKFAVRSIPRTVLISRKGRVIGDNIGYLEPGAFVKWIQANSPALDAVPDVSSAAAGYDSVGQVSGKVKQALQNPSGITSDELVELLTNPQAMSRSEMAERIRAAPGGWKQPLTGLLTHPYLGARIAAWELLEAIGEDVGDYDPWAPVAERNSTAQALSER